MSRKSRRHTCYLCLFKKKKDGMLSDVSNTNLIDPPAYHKFPGSNQLRVTWVKACGLDENDDVSSIRICSNHFTVHDYIDLNARKFGGTMRLKVNAYPTKLLPKKQNASSTCYVSRITEVPASLPSEQIIGESDSSCIGHGNEDASSTSYVSSITAVPASLPSKQLIGEPDSSCIGNGNEGTKDYKASTPKRKCYNTPRYIGDLASPHVSTPRRARDTLKFVKDTIKKKDYKIRMLKQQNRRYLKKIKTLQDLVSHLRKKNMISEDAEESILSKVPPPVKDLIESKLKSRRHRKYSPEIRRFALTLHFYSPKAYGYIRKIWNNLLPCSSTLRNWYSVVNGKPGFTLEAFKSIAAKAKCSEIPISCNIVMDEMAIKEELVFDGKHFYGGVNIGTDVPSDDDNQTKARNALVFMAVVQNGNWKVPLGYFLIKNLNGEERANLLTKCLEQMHDTGCKVHSLTFDGAPVNIKMCSVLGACFDIGNNFKPHFNSPVTQEPIFVMWDACHMIKLIRNTIGQKKILIDSDGNYIKWSYIERIWELQNKEGLHSGNKLTKKHIAFEDNKMSVKLAVQTLSESVAKSLKFASELKIAGFDGCLPTANFCYTFNHIFDMLNCRSKYAKRNTFNIPLCDDNFNEFFTKANEFIAYIRSLKDSNGTPVIHTARKTGFLGLIICLTNIFPIFFKLKENKLTYLLTFKLSQDCLETFFCCIRARGGFNNNPNAKQFETAYKRLLIRHEISTSINSNCLEDDVEILTVSSRKLKIKEPLGDLVHDTVDLFDHDYIKTMWSLSPYVENVVQYIAGYVANATWKKISCSICRTFLFNNTEEGSLLLNIRNRGPLKTPSKDVEKICLITERKIREFYTELFRNNSKHIIAQSVFNGVLLNTFNSEVMNAHISSQGKLDNHKSQMIKLLIDVFIKVRYFHEAKLASEKNTYIRQKYTKLIQFRGM